MIRVLMNLKGTGKTKTLINWVNDAVSEEAGDVVCINKDNRLLYDINHKARLIDSGQFRIQNFDMFYGFLCGLIAQNFDITHIFIDSILKVVPADIQALDTFIEKLETLSDQFNVRFSFTVTADPNETTPNIRKYA
jgi:hypothetical protein